MDKIPQECHNLIGSFLKKEDRLNLALTSKSFYYYFNAANWGRVTLRGTPEELYRILGFFLDERYAPKYPLIKHAIIVLCSAASGEEIPAGLTKCLVDSLSRMTCVETVVLLMTNTHVLDLAEFTQGMAAAPRWDKVEWLRLNCDEGIAAAVLGRCEVDIVGHVALGSWCSSDDDEDDPVYRTLKSRYSTQSHLLKSLEIEFPFQEVGNGVWDLIHEQSKGVNKVIEDFPSLDRLRICNDAWWKNCPTSDQSSYQEFEDGIDEFCKALNNSTLEDLDLDISASLVDRGFIAHGLQEIFPLDYSGYFDGGHYVDETDEDFEIAIDNWFFQLARKIGMACPQLRSVTVNYRSNDFAYTERIDDWMNAYIRLGKTTIYPGDEGLWVGQ